MSKIYKKIIGMASRVDKDNRTAANLYAKAYEMDVYESRIEDNRGPKAARMGVSMRTWQEKERMTILH